MWTTIRAYVVGGVLLAFALLGLMYELKSHSLSKAKGQVKEAQEQAQRATQELTEAKLSFRVDLDALKQAQTSKDALVDHATKVKEKVDEVAKKVEAGQLSDAAADAQLLDSMWEAFCKGSSDPTCSTRAANTGHKGKPST